jgi:hypothetical protein
MSLLREVLQDLPISPEDGWDVGHLADLGVLISSDEYSFRLDHENLNALFDSAESMEDYEIRDHEGHLIEVHPTEGGIILFPANEHFEDGILLDLKVLKVLGIEQYEEHQGDDDLEFAYDPLTDDVMMSDEFDPLDEGIKRAFRRSGKKIKRGFRVTSGFRKGRVVSSPSGAFKPRAKASTRMKLRIKARRKKVIRVLKGKRTRRKSASKRLVRMNKRLK